MGKNKKKNGGPKGEKRSCEVSLKHNGYNYIGKKGINIILYGLTLLPFLKTEVYDSSFSIFYMCITFPLAPILDILNSKYQYNKKFANFMFFYFSCIALFGLMGFLGIFNLVERNIVFDGSTILSGKILFKQSNFMLCILVSVFFLFLDFIVSGFQVKGKNTVTNIQAGEWA